MEINGFEIEEYNIYGFKEGATHAVCPKCSHKRKPENQKKKCMSLFWDTGLGVCNHCDEKRLQLHKFKSINKDKTYLKPVVNNFKPSISDNLINYAKEHRGISKSTLESLKISSLKTWMPLAGKDVEAIRIPYYFLGELINVKYRAKNKDFKFEKGCEKIMYNLDSIIGQNECVVVEGEIDCWAFVEAGVNNCTSVPNGFTLPKKDGSSSINTSYLDNYYDIFESKEKIYIAVDNDEAGKCGESELIIRFGAEKCWLIDFKDCKDANDYLLKYGKEALKQTLQDAKQVPLEYVETLSHFEEELDDFWINGSPKGYTTGIRDLDKIYSTELSQYTIITAPPQAGKSEFVDAICIGYAMRYGFKTAFASPENKPNKFHADKIIRKIAGYKPSTRNQVESKRIQRTKDFYKDHFFHVEFDTGYELKKTLKKFEELVKRKGVKVFVLDPYNKIKLGKPKSTQINDYTNEYLNEVDIFCKKNNCILFLVAHPTKMEKEDGTQTFKMPNAYNIKGGGEMFDMAYHILGLVKNVEERLVKLRTLKVKFQHLGEPDRECWFGWNVNNGRYTEVDYDPDNGENGVLQWDNSDWLATNEEKDQVATFDEQTGEVEIDYLSNFDSEFDQLDEAPF